jgi:hypothetical protein
MGNLEKAYDGRSKLMSRYAYDNTEADCAMMEYHGISSPAQIEKRVEDRDKYALRCALEYISNDLTSVYPFGDYRIYLKTLECIGYKGDFEDVLSALTEAGWLVTLNASSNPPYLSFRP